MPMIQITHKGDFSKTDKFLRGIKERHYLKILDKYGQMGVDALRAATPRRSGKTAESWGYEIRVGGDMAEIIWTNTNVENGWFYVAIGLQYGHGTRNGGYVQGIDYINPAMRPIFDKIADEAWAEVISS